MDGTLDKGFIPELVVRGTKFISIDHAHDHIFADQLSNGHVVVWKDKNTGRIRCQREGQRRPNNKKIPGATRRERLSVKCNCEWQARVDPDSLVLIRYDSLSAHNHDAAPSGQLSRDYIVKKRIAQQIGFDKIVNEITELRAENIDTRKLVNLTRKRTQYQLLQAKDINNLLQRERNQQPQQTNVEALVQFLDENSWLYDTFIVDDHLARIAWLSPSMLQNLQKFGEVCLFDTTYKKKKFNLPLAILAVVDLNGYTRIAGAAMLECEKIEAITWVLDFFRQKAGWQPRVIFTDGDLAFARALSTINGCRHFLCIFHMIQNIRINCIKILGRSEINCLFSECLEVREKADYPSFWTAWNQFLDRHPKAKPYLEKQFGGENIYKWARFSLNSCFTIDINTTSRVESINKLISDCLDYQSTLVDVVQRLEKINSNLACSSNYKAYKFFTRNLTKAETKGAAAVYERNFLEHLSHAVSSFAFSMILFQMEFGALLYDVKEYQENAEVISSEEHAAAEKMCKEDNSLLNIFISDEDNVQFERSAISEKAYQVFPRVKQSALPNGQSVRQQFVRLLSNGLALCSCGLGIRSGVPCRHVFAVVFLKEVLFVPKSLINQRWFTREPISHMIAVRHGQKLQSIRSWYTKEFASWAVSLDFVESETKVPAKFVTNELTPVAEEKKADFRALLKIDPKYEIFDSNFAINLHDF